MLYVRTLVATVLLGGHDPLFSLVSVRFLIVSANGNRWRSILQTAAATYFLAKLPNNDNRVSQNKIYMDGEFQHAQYSTATFLGDS